MGGKHSWGQALLPVLLLLASCTVQAATTADLQATTSTCEHVATLPPGEACAWAERHCETGAACRAREKAETTGQPTASARP